jgi:hypothetical protein
MVETIFMNGDCSQTDKIYGYHAVPSDCSDPKWLNVECVNGSIWSFCTYDPDAFINSLAPTPFVGIYDLPFVGNISNPQIPAGFQVPGKVQDFEDIKYHPIDGSCLSNEDYSMTVRYNAEAHGIQAAIYANLNCSGEPFFGEFDNGKEVSFHDDEILFQGNIYKIVQLGGFEPLNFTNF